MADRLSEGKVSRGLDPGGDRYRQPATQCWPPPLLVRCRSGSENLRRFPAGAAQVSWLQHPGHRALPMSALFPPPGVAVLSVAELTRALKELVEEAHPSVWVQG